MLIRSVLALYLLFSSVVADMECLDGQVFIEKPSGDVSRTKIVTRPNTTNVLPVNGSRCGFQVEGLTWMCNKMITIKFVSINLTRKSENPCSVWKDSAVCYCDFYGCNSVEGTLYDAVLRTQKTTANDPISSMYSGALLAPTKRDKALDRCLSKILEKAYNQQVPINLVSSRLSVDDFQKKHPSMFPNASEVAEMKLRGAQKNPTTLPPSTTVTVPTSAKVPIPSLTAAPSALHHGGPAGATAAPSNNTAALIGVIIGGVILVVILFGLGLGYFLYRRRDKQQLEKIEEIEKKEEQEAKLSGQMTAVLKAMAQRGPESSFNAYVELRAESKKLPAQATIPFYPDAHFSRSIPCYESTRVHLSKEVDPKQEFIYHANGWKLSNGTFLIATQYPLEMYGEEFWLMMFGKKSDVVVKLYNDKFCYGHPEFYLKEGMGKQEFGEVSIDVAPPTTPLLIDEYTRHVLITLTYKGRSHILHHFEFLIWSDFGMPDSLKLNRLLLEIEKLKPSVITVLCQSGVTKTGTVCALLEAASDVKMNIPVDMRKIFIRCCKNRWRMIQHSAQFKYIHIVFADYLLMKGLITEEGAYTDLLKQFKEWKADLEDTLEEIKKENKKSPYLTTLSDNYLTTCMDRKKRFIEYLRMKDAAGDKNYAMIE